MQDQFQREIDYLRVSVTDRCNLRCVYCMPETGVEWIPHEEILTYEEILRLCRVFAGLGIRAIRLTGGEPLCRRGVPGLVKEMKDIPGIERVTLTTNAVALAEQLPALLDGGLDGVNISLDTLNRAQYTAITRRDCFDRTVEGLQKALDAPGLSVKINCVPTEENWDQLIPLARLAKVSDLTVRFIELMPIGLGAEKTFRGERAVRGVLEREFGPMIPFEEKLGRGPCRYMTLAGFRGKIGFISALSHNFCGECNRIRLTAQGFLKTCLQYDLGEDLKFILRGGGSEDDLEQAVKRAIQLKPDRHHFEETNGESNLERHGMSQIGG